MNGIETLVIINPHAGLLNPGAAGAGEVRYLARQILPQAKIITTHSEEHAKEVVETGIQQGIRTVAGAGGDGTTRFLAGMLAGTSTAVGIIPLGSAGNVGRALGIPASPRRALMAIRRGRRKKIDIGYVNGEHFIEAAGIGLHADMLKRYALRDRKSLFRGAYSMTKTLSECEPFEAELEIDGKIFRRRAIQITISNLPLYGTGFEIAPGAKMDDGFLDISVLGNIPAAAVPGLALAARLGLLHRDQRVKRFRAAAIVIRTDEPLAIHADAESAGETPAEFSVLRRSLNIVVP